MTNRIWTRPFQLHDLPQIEGIYRRLYPNASHFDAFITRHRLWVVGKDEELWGYTAVLPIPGIDHIYELQGGVLPEKRRRGVASRLLQRVLADLAGSKPLQLSYGTTDMNAPAIRFLRAHRFYNEHEEWLYERPLDDCPLPLNNAKGTMIAQLADANHRFLALYNASFAPHRWYQPFSEEELAETLDAPSNILFLMQNDRPIGFAWMHPDGAIEPIGILPEEQGKGYGRYLLLSALNHLQQKGITTAKIGVWKENETAVRLYENAGFRKTETLTYLAYDL